MSTALLSWELTDTKDTDFEHVHPWTRLKEPVEKWNHRGILSRSVYAWKIYMSDVVISYSCQEQEFVKKLYQVLSRK
jgi:hypothetical protein